MIKHIVMWKFYDVAEGSTKAQNLEKARGLLESLKGNIPEIQRLEVGINLAESDQAYDMVLSADFENAAGLKTYLDHPEHQVVADFVGKVRTHRAVVDYSC